MFAFSFSLHLPLHTHKDREEGKKAVDGEGEPEKNLSKQSWSFIKNRLPRQWFKTCNLFSDYVDNILVAAQITFLSVSSNFASEAQKLTSAKMSSKNEKMSLVNTVYYSSGYLIGKQFEMSCVVLKVHMLFSHTCPQLQSKPHTYGIFSFHIQDRGTWIFKVRWWIW